MWEAQGRYRGFVDDFYFDSSIGNSFSQTNAHGIKLGFNTYSTCSFNTEFEISCSIF